MFTLRALAITTYGETSSGRVAAQRQLNQILGWLWDVAAGPVLDALGYRTQATPRVQWPRLWWAPGGLMGPLPIHAAGHHSDPADDPGRRAVINRVISSYTPTITALRHARRLAYPPAGEGMPPQALIVVMPTTPGLPGSGELRFVREEARMIAERLPGAIILTEPDSADGDDASGAAFDPDAIPTRSNVFAHLADCPVAHFACHGDSDAADPSNGRLLLHDHRETPLTVSALNAVRLDRARLAYLSACTTALFANAELIDEAIHLASAFQLAGYPHVIGTLWPIDNYVAVQIADSFYATLASKALDSAVNTSYAAVALHDAIRAIRDRYPAAPSLWASHMHAGA